MPVIDPVGFLGREFIAYVSACDEALLDSALADPAEPGHARVRGAVARCGQLLQHHWPVFVPELATVPAGKEVSVANLLRSESGGSLPTIPAEGGILEPLARIARDFFPVCLLAPQHEPSVYARLATPGHRLVGSLESHPAIPDFQHALGNDDLSELFETDPPPPFLAFASGSGTAFQRDSLPLALIGAAAVRARLLRREFDFDAVVAELRALLDDLRSIRAGSEIRLPVVVALHGVNLEPDIHVELPGGVLRAATDGATQKAVGDVFFPQGGLFVTMIPSAVEVSSASAEDGPRTSPLSKTRAFRRDLEARIQQVTLSLLLVDAWPRLSAVATRAVAITPAFGVGWGAGEYNPPPVPGPTGTLTESHIEKLRSLATFVSDRYGASLAIPTRRLISAVVGRHDVDDGLVDAVVAWESLFAGTDHGELRFRISAAMSWLMGHTAEERLELQREIASLYDTRSRVVHRGAAGPDLTAERDRAVELGISAMLALLRDHPDLIDDENRGKKLILRGEPPPA